MDESCQVVTRASHEHNTTQTSPYSSFSLPTYSLYSDIIRGLLHSVQYVVCSFTSSKENRVATRNELASRTYSSSQ